MLAPVYATLPIWRMGQLALYDAYLSVTTERPLDLFSLDDVDDAFEKVIQLKFQQHHALTGKGAGIVVTPYAAGHSLGATVWKIKKDTDELVYAIDFNHRKERHLNPTALVSIARPSHLILGCSQMLAKHNPKSDVTSLVVEAMEERVDVLLPIDTAGRVVEIALQLDELWTAKKWKGQCSVCVVHTVAFNTFEFARSMIEWMSDLVANKFDETRLNPFSFRNVEIVHSIQEVEMLPGPKVVLASFPSLDTGFARELFIGWCTRKNFMLLIADRMEPGTLVFDIYQKYQAANGEPFSVDVSIRKKQPLEGNELREYRENQRKEREKQERQEMLLKNRRRRGKRGSSMMDTDMNGALNDMNDVAGEDGVDDGDDDSDASMEDLDLDGITDLAYIPGDNIRLTMFPYQEKNKVWDDYGEVLDVTQFMIGEDPGGDDDEDLQAMAQFSRPAAANAEGSGKQNVEEEIPTKYVELQASLLIRCMMKVCDQLGLSDGRSIRQIVSSVAPRRLIVVHGTEEESESALEYATGEKGLMLKPSEVYMPKTMESIDVTSDTSVYRIILFDSLFANTQWYQLDDIQVAYLNGSIRVDEKEGTVGLEAPKQGAVQEGHPAIFLGDLRISELKEQLRNQLNLRSEFAGGCLCIENHETRAIVLVKKVGPGEVLLEGAYSEEYFMVRDMLYDQFVVL